MAALKHTPPARHVPALLDLGAALVLFLDTLGHGFPLGCFLSTQEEKPEYCPSSACCPGAVRVSISSPSSLGLDTHPGGASTACPDLCLMWKQRQKSYINLFPPSGIIFSKCTSPLLPFGPAKGWWQAGRAVNPSLHPCSNPGSSSSKSLWDLEVILPLFVPPLTCLGWGAQPCSLTSQPQHTAPGLAPTFD